MVLGYIDLIEHASWNDLTLSNSVFGHIGLGRIMRCITQRSNVPSAESSKGSRHLASQEALSEGWGHAPRSGTAASYADTMASLRS